MQVLKCIDVGSDYCPCYLAELGECIVCSMLRKKQVCECEWSGTCVYLEYQWLGEAAKAGRITRKSPVMYKEPIRDNLFLVSLDVGRNLARDLNRPGSFLFLRGDVQNHFFDVPIAVIQADAEKGSVLVAVGVCGPKTKRLQKSNDWMFIRGPYWNGVFGQRFINGTQDAKTLVVLGGISQASGVLVANRMVANGNSVSVLFNSDDIVFIEPYLDPQITIFKATVLSPEWFRLIQGMIENDGVACIYSGGNDRQHAVIRKLIIRSKTAVFLSTSNNSTIHCGEGICGSCIRSSGGQLLRSCKIQR
jgi:NAD(P)H-flavin reductase